MEPHYTIHFYGKDAEGNWTRDAFWKRPAFEQHGMPPFIADFTDTVTLPVQTENGIEERRFRVVDRDIHYRTDRTSYSQVTDGSPHNPFRTVTVALYVEADPA